MDGIRMLEVLIVVGLIRHSLPMSCSRQQNLVPTLFA